MSYRWHSSWTHLLLRGHVDVIPRQVQPHIGQNRRPGVNRKLGVLPGRAHRRHQNLQNKRSSGECDIKTKYDLTFYHSLPSVHSKTTTINPPLTEVSDECHWWDEGDGEQKLSSRLSWKLPEHRSETCQGAFEDSLWYTLKKYLTRENYAHALRQSQVRPGVKIRVKGFHIWKPRDCTVQGARRTQI